MSKLNKVKELLQKVLASFNQVSTDKGLVYWEGDAEMPEIGQSVYGLDEEGNQIALEDGEYALEDGTILIIKDGKIEDIIKKTEEPAAPEAEEPAEPEEGENEPEAEPESPESMEDEPAEPEENPMEKKMAALEERLAALEERLAALENKPAAEPAAEQFKRVNKVGMTGNEKLDRLSTLMSAR